MLARGRVSRWQSLQAPPYNPASHQPGDCRNGYPGSQADRNPPPRAHAHPPRAALPLENADCSFTISPPTMPPWVQNATSRDHPALPSLVVRAGRRRRVVRRGGLHRRRAARPCPCMSSKRESSRPALHMCGQRDGASLTSTAVDTRSPARATTAVLELPGRRAPLKRWGWPSSAKWPGSADSLSGGGLEIQCPTMTPARGNCGRRLGPWPDDRGSCAVSAGAAVLGGV